MWAVEVAGCIFNSLECLITPWGLHDRASVGSPGDVPLRVPSQEACCGTPILTAIEGLRASEQTKRRTPAPMCGRQRERMIVIMASGECSKVKDASQEQLIRPHEARKQGLHARARHRDAVLPQLWRGATNRAAWSDGRRPKLMVDKGTYFDPQAGLVLKTIP
jgi:hypothetical protein